MVFPFRKFLLSFAALLVLAAVLKWAVDTCLPPYQGASIVFPHQGLKPTPLCGAVLEWDLWAREKQAIRASKQNFVRDAPGALQTDEGKPTKILFSADAIKLTVLLSRIPHDRFATFQLLVLVCVLSVLISVLWQWLYYLATSPKGFAKRKGAPAPKSLASQAILPDYLPSEASGRTGRPRNPSTRASGAAKSEDDGSADKAPH